MLRNRDHVALDGATHHIADGSADDDGALLCRPEVLQQFWPCARVMRSF